MISSLGFGFNIYNYQIFNFAFTSPNKFIFSSLYILTCCSIMQKVRRLFCRLLFLFKFDNIFLFHSFHKVLFKISFTVLISLSVNFVVFKFRKWASCLRTNFLGFRLTLLHLFFGFYSFLKIFFSLSKFMRSFSNFAHHYFWNHCLFFFPFGTEMFHFPKFMLLCLYFRHFNAQYI